MKLRLFIALVIAIIFVGIGYFFFFQKEKQKIVFEPELKNTMIVTSSAFGQNGSIPSKYTCDGESMNPPLEVKDVPVGSQSLVLIVDDPDAVRGTYTHWVVYNIGPQTTIIPEHGVPAGAVEGLTSSGKTGYGGPCPPSGVHRYFFKLYALDTMLNLPAGADKAALEKAMEEHVLEKAELVGLYSRE